MQTVACLADNHQLYLDMWLLYIHVHKCVYMWLLSILIIFFQKTIGNSLFRCWGWNNEVNVFDPNTATWSMPETQVSISDHFPFCGVFLWVLTGDNEEMLWSQNVRFWFLTRVWFLPPEAAMPVLFWGAKVTSPVAWWVHSMSLISL